MKTSELKNLFSSISSIDFDCIINNYSRDRIIKALNRITEDTITISYADTINNVLLAVRTVEYSAATDMMLKNVTENEIIALKEHFSNVCVTEDRSVLTAQDIKDAFSFFERATDCDAEKFVLARMIADYIFCNKQSSSEIRKFFELHDDADISVLDNLSADTDEHVEKFGCRFFENEVE